MLRWVVALLLAVGARAPPPSWEEFIEAPSWSSIASAARPWQAARMCSQSVSRPGRQSRSLGVGNGRSGRAHWHSRAHRILRRAHFCHPFVEGGRSRSRRSLPLPAAPCQSLPLPTTPCRCRTLPASADSLNPSRGREWEGCVFEFSPRLSLSLPPSLPLSQRAPSLAPSFPHPWPHSCLFISRRFLLSQTTDWRRSNHILSRCERLVPLLSPRLVLARAEGDPVPH